MHASRELLACQVFCVDGLVVGICARLQGPCWLAAHGGGVWRKEADLPALHTSRAVRPLLTREAGSRKPAASAGVSLQLRLNSARHLHPGDGSSCMCPAKPGCAASWQCAECFATTTSSQPCTEQGVCWVGEQNKHVRLHGCAHGTALLAGTGETQVACTADAGGAHRAGWR